MRKLVSCWFICVLLGGFVSAREQGEELYLRPGEILFGYGKRYWSRFIFKTHRAESEELRLTTFVFYPLEFPDIVRIDANQYRTTDWALGQISSVQKLPRGVVKVDGTPYDVGLLRISDTPLQRKY